MTGPEHYREAERLAEQAEHWANADTGWKAGMSGGERLTRRAGDLAAAQVHATLAQVAAFALSQRIATSEDTTGHPSHEHYEDWHDAIEGGGDDE